VLALPGNQTALLHVPTLFFFLDIDAELAQQRLHGRRGHVAEDIFDDQGFQTALRERYQLPEVTDPWTSRGTRIITLDGSQTKEQITQAMCKYLDELDTV
jgi:thymidylate kinase